MRFTEFKEMLSFYADKTPEAPALRYEQDGALCTLTYAELTAAVRERAEKLRQFGGTCLGVVADGSIECALTLLAAPASGMRTVLFDAAAPEETVRAQAGRLNVDRIFAEGKLSGTERFFAVGLKKNVQKKRVPDLTGGKITLTEEESVGDFGRREAEKESDISDGNKSEKNFSGENERVDDIAGEILFFTSGTTGAGRAVILTEQTLCASAYNGSAMLPLSSADTLLCILPLNHVFGVVCGFLWGLSCGACVALGRGARHYMDDCTYFKPTAVSAVPMLFGFLLKHNFLNPECKLVLVGAGDCPASLLRVAKAQGIRVSFGYGLTETSSGVAISTEGDPYAMAVCPDDEVIIAEDGEILIKAPTCVMKGYAGEPEATAEVLRDGVLATGDLGYLDQDGKLHVTGRKKEMLVLTDGTKLFLPEAEEELAALTGTEDLAIVLSGERPVLILGGEPEGGTKVFGKTPDPKAEDGKTAEEKLTEDAVSDRIMSKEKAGDEISSGSKNFGEKAPEGMSTGVENFVGKSPDGTAPEDVIWEKIRSFQDARPRGQQISAIRWYGKPLPRTATGKLKRWMLGNG
ncbi:MAG: acyl--CoA ligase [Lachnospiraceae bacterium]|nr:acyl--CoA ligase [Lachnospiraceae bacterium]